MLSNPGLLAAPAQPSPGWQGRSGFPQTRLVGQYFKIVYYAELGLINIVVTLGFSCSFADTYKQRCTCDSEYLAQQRLFDVNRSVADLLC